MSTEKEDVGEIVDSFALLQHAEVTRMLTSPETARQLGEQAARVIWASRLRRAEVKAQGWESSRKQVDPVTGDVTYYYGDFIESPRQKPCDECTDGSRCSRIGQCLRYRCAFGEVDKP